MIWQIDGADKRDLVENMSFCVSVLDDMRERMID